MRLKNKKGFEFSFGWLFALIVGAVILFLAIYAATNLINQDRKVQDTFAGQQLGIILSPVETSLESAKTTLITFPVTTRVFNSCDSTGSFGSQKISVATESGVGSQWTTPGVPSTFYNKYIFSASTVEGKGATVFVKPFNFPYKVADLIFLWSNQDNYCFINAPTDVQDEISGLSINSINFTSDIKQCIKNSITVCFSSSVCNVDVNLNSQSVKKNGQTVFYSSENGNSLLYGAIFADPEVYNCQVKRLMERTASLAVLYRQKSEALSSKGCSSNLEGSLDIFANDTLSLNSTIQLRSIDIEQSQLGTMNSALSCKLF